MNQFENHITDLLVEECRRGNSRAQLKLYKQYSKAMYNIACRMMNNREDAEDILQEAFVECFRSIETFRYESTFGAWLKRILINRCLNQLRRKKTELVYYESLPDIMPDEEPDIVPDPGIISKGIEQLPDGYRIILSLYLLEGYDHGEIAQILGITESTSKSQYSRARTRLKTILSKEKVYGQA
jgi:RNA polymerase sigma factor (sigma-70 family)